MDGRGYFQGGEPPEPIDRPVNGRVSAALEIADPQHPTWWGLTEFGSLRVYVPEPAMTQP